MINTKPKLPLDTASRKQIITLPRVIVGIVILCLVFQIQRSKSVELPKYTLPEYVKQSILERVNNHRASVRVRELILNDSLSAEAYRYCEMIAKGNLQANLSATLSTEDVDAWDKKRGITRNVVVFEPASTSPAFDAMRMWLKHNDAANNLESASASLTGIGVVKRGNVYVICQIFASASYARW
ncbi:MAG: hypothetical protein RML40_00485 [Bacteroidota bacterium]|nr:hypothetical protein [Candidatus Kapabacteria bacterium]MDW8218983.1 hypothetical protein [Bacteroidota bacterium]